MITFCTVAFGKNTLFPVNCTANCNGTKVGVVWVSAPVIVMNTRVSLGNNDNYSRWVSWKFLPRATVRSTIISILLAHLLEHPSVFSRFQTRERRKLLLPQEDMWTYRLSRTRSGRFASSFSGGHHAEWLGRCAATRRPSPCRLASWPAHQHPRPRHPHQHPHWVCIHCLKQSNAPDQIQLRHFWSTTKYAFYEHIQSHGYCFNSSHHMLLYRNFQLGPDGTSIRLKHEININTLVTTMDNHYYVMKQTQW